MILGAFIDVATKKAETEVADILRLHLDEYLQKYHCTAQELRALNAIMKCRTAACGWDWCVDSLSRSVHAEDSDQQSTHPQP
jgi:hypothetical protein